MTRKFSAIVLWQCILCAVVTSVAYSQGGDSVSRTDTTSQIVFQENKATVEGVSTEPQRMLQGIARVGAGLYTAAHEGLAEKVVQPIVGFDFYANPGGSWGLLFGGTLGFTPEIATAIHFGLRQPLITRSSLITKLFLDGSILFSQDGELPEQFQTGGRLVLAALIPSNLVDVEARLAGEYRGTRELLDGSRRQLWWAGAELGVSFSLLSESRTLTKQDSILAALRYISSPEEIEDFQTLRSQREMDEWIDVFWRKRDVTPETAINEAREEFESRVALVNSRFGRSRQLGAETAPGRAIILNGRPHVYVIDKSTSDPAREYMLMEFNNRVQGYLHAVYLFYNDYNHGWRLGYSNIPEEGVSSSLPWDLPRSIVSALPPLLR